MLEVTFRLELANPGQPGFHASPRPIGRTEGLLLAGRCRSKQIDELAHRLVVGDRIKLEIASKVSADRRLRQASTDKYFGTPSRTMRASSDLHTKGSTLSALLTDPIRRKRVA